MSKKGLSFEEKRSRMLKFFHEKQDFFLLKEVERLCQKEKGITSMSAKDVLQSLVDDNLVDSEKIGTCVFFWSFPSKIGEKKKRRLQELEACLEAQSAKKAKLTGDLEVAKVGKDASDDRTSLTEALADVETRLKEAERRLQERRECDPEVLDSLLADARLAHQAANRWTDNIFSLMSWMQSKFPGVGQAQICAQFGVPEELDYLDPLKLATFG